MKNLILKTIQEGEDKFHEKFYSDDIDSEYGGSGCITWHGADKECKMKSFNRFRSIKLLEAVKARLEGGMFIDTSQAGEFSLHADGYNQALEEKAFEIGVLITHLQQEKK